MFEDNGKKKVLFLAKKDFAGSGVKLSEALNQFSKEYQSRFIALETPNYNAKSDIVTNDRAFIQNAINQSDIIHLKGDQPLSYYKKYSFIGKALYQTVGGSNFRRKTKDYYPKEVATEKFSLSQYNRVVLSGITPELTDYFIPHAIDVKENIWKQPKGKIKICHSPSDRHKKGTEIIIEAIKDIENIEFILIENKTNKEVIEIKKNCHLFIDQIILEAYGMNSVECMAMGIPVISSCFDLPDCPVFKINYPSVEVVKKTIIFALENLNKNTSNKFYEWAVKTHSYKAVSDKLEQFYKSNIKICTMKNNNKIDIEIIKDVAGMEVGTIKSLAPSIANSLIDRGIAKVKGGVTPVVKEQVVLKEEKECEGCDDKKPCTDCEKTAETTNIPDSKKRGRKK